jgi:hypothetical protein
MYFRRRLPEWINSFIIMALGLLLLIFPSNFGTSTVDVFSQHPTFWSFGLLSVATLRIIALLINGHWNGGTPLLRFLGSLMGAAIFGAMVGSLLQIGAWYSVPVLFCIVAYTGLMIGELITSFYTASDMANVRKYGQ